MVNTMIEITLAFMIIYGCASMICFCAEGIIKAIVRLCTSIYTHIRTFRKNNCTPQRTLGADDES